MAGDAAVRAQGRLTFQQQMQLDALPDRMGDGKVVRRFISRRAAFVPGEDLPFPQGGYGRGDPPPLKSNIAFGGHVYSQAGLAASRALATMMREQGSTNVENSKKQFAIHTIHGYFTEVGRVDRAFIYEVTSIAENQSFPNLLVSARQPTEPSRSRGGDFFPLEDAEIPLGPVCFSAVVSFRPEVRRQVDLQEPSPHIRFSEILSSRPPAAWDPAPLVDIDSIVSAVPEKPVGWFPIVDMKKVDLTVVNQGKPYHERKELIMYRLIAPLPESEPDLHILTHAFEADRNGLLMVGNHAGFGFDFGRALTLSNSFVVHVNPQDAVMKYGDDEWWIQEVCFPRLDAARGIVMCKIWSPSGVHVATQYQDGIIQKANSEKRQGKL
ncbi:thioesterase-like superfamily-domain-containing protein [Xylariales sp. PMI_506]|nr:thioesterase-like superfamily-domain-containing protein [Xylariales sp. PMI_506]